MSRVDGAEGRSTGEAPVTGAPEPADEAPRRRGRPPKVPRDLLRARILDAAARVFADRGFAEATTEEIASVAGIARPSVYDQFGSKADLFVAVVERSMARIFEHMGESLATTGHLLDRERTSANLAAFFEVLVTEPEHVLMLRLADRGGVGAAGERASAMRQELVAAIAQYLIDVWTSPKLIAPADAHLLATMIEAGVEAIAFRHLESPDRSIEELVSFITEFLHGGFSWLDGNPDHLPAGDAP